MVFHEIQRFPKWIYVLISISLLTIIGILYQAYIENPEEHARLEIIHTLLFVLVTEALVILLLTTVRQEVRIDPIGVSFRYPPFKNKYTTIPFEAIIDFDQEQLSLFQLWLSCRRMEYYEEDTFCNYGGLDKVNKINLTRITTFSRH